jgi:hypothetical protein
MMGQAIGPVVGDQPAFTQCIDIGKQTQRYHIGRFLAGDHRPRLTR